MTFTHALSTNNYGPEKFIVSANAYEGTHTTIASALTAAASGDTIFVRPGTYTENLTLKAGVNIVANEVDGMTPNVNIIGKATFTAAGTTSLSGVQLQTNSDFALAVTGSAASIVNLYNCFLNFSNNTGISFTSSSASSQIIVWDCRGNLGTTGIGYFAHSGAGAITFLSCNFGNSGGSSTANTISGSGSFNIETCYLPSPLSYSSTSLGSQRYSTIDTSGQNVTAMTVNISGALNSDFCKYTSGSATPVVVTAGTLSIRNATLESSNATNVSGAGTMNYSNLTFANTNQALTVTTPFPYSGTSTSWVLISTQTASNVATISFTDMVSKGSFKSYVLVLENVVPATNSVTPTLKVSSNGGSSYIATGYSSTAVILSAGGVDGTNNTTTSFTFTKAADLNNTAAKGLSGTFFLVDVNSGVTPSFYGEGTYWSTQYNATVGSVPVCVGANGPAATTVNALQFAMSSGNVSTGIFSLYGILS